MKDFATTTFEGYSPNTFNPFDDTMYFQLGRLFATDFSIEKRNLYIDDQVLAKFSPDADELVSIDRGFRAIPPRLKGHIKRLTTFGRSVEENYFGLVFCMHGIEFHGEKDRLQKYPDVACDDLPKTNWWWTVSPYLLVKLVQKGLSAKEAFGFVAKWGREIDYSEEDVLDDNVEVMTEADYLVALADIEYGITPVEDLKAYPGLEDIMEWYTNPPPVLSGIPCDISHQFADYCAEQVVEKYSPIVQRLSEIAPK